MAEEEMPDIDNLFDDSPEENADLLAEIEEITDSAEDNGESEIQAGDKTDSDTENDDQLTEMVAQIMSDEEVEDNVAEEEDDEEEEILTFECPGCRQSLAVGMEDLGTKMECPQCLGTIQTPNLREDPTAQFHFEYPGAEKIRDVDDDDGDEGDEIDLTDSIAHLYFADFDEAKYIYGLDLSDFRHLSRDHCWEAAVAAEIIKLQLEPLRTLIQAGNLEQKVEKGLNQHRKEYRVWVEACFLEFMEIYEYVHGFVSRDLLSVLDCDNLSDILPLSVKVKLLSLNLQNFHENIFLEPLPHEHLGRNIMRTATIIRTSLSKKNAFVDSDVDPFLEVNRVLKTWVPPCLKSLDDIAAQLKRHSVKKRDESQLNLEFAFAPSSLHRFFSVVSILEAPEGPPRTVYTDFGDEH